MARKRLVDQPRQQLVEQVSHICMWTNQEEQLGRQTTQPRFQGGIIKPQNLSLKKPVGVVVAGETPSYTGESIGETQRVLECTQPTHLGVSTRRA